MYNQLRQLLNRVVERARVVRFLQLTGIFWFLTAIGVLIAAWRNNGFAGVPFLLVVLGVIVLATLSFFLAALCALFSFRDQKRIGDQIESAFPDLNQSLLAALELRPQNGRLGFLESEVVQQAALHGRRHDWRSIITRGQRFGAWLTAILGACSLGGLLYALNTITFPEVQPETPSSLVVAAPESSIEFQVEPGNADVEKGTGMIVTARFSKHVPESVKITTWNESNEPVETSMSRSLDDPVFAIHLSEVDKPFSYQVDFENGKSETFKVDVFEFPSLVQSDATLEFPEYTKQPTKVVEDTYRVTVVEGTDVGWKLELNKSVKSARLLDEAGNAVDLEQNNQSETTYENSQVALESKSWKLELVDDAGRKNRFPSSLLVKVVPNKRPSLKTSGAGDVRVSPLEELSLKANVFDDFGVEKFGVSYAFADEKPRDIVLAEEVASKKKDVIDHTVKFEDLKAEPDQLLAYHFWAEDRGPDGKIRRTPGDMYFAEVRHFEEIFREGESPPGGQQARQQQQQQGGQNAQQSEKLADLQKQIINATWSVVRRESDSAEPSKLFEPDVKLLAESQNTAIEQLSALEERLQDAQSKKFAEAVRGHMQKAVEQLEKAVSDKAMDALFDAMTFERASYQALLKLRAREFTVSRQQGNPSSGSPSAGAQQFQQQLQQLELKNDQNRYETERQAQEQESEQDSQLRQVMSRLRELSQRQGDLNKQLKDLQTALQSAETEDEKEEIERMLKRLRDQQEQLLRDMDELQNRLEESDPEKVQQTQQQVEQSRQNVQQATEALRERNASKALAAGTRAERKLKQAQEQLRKETANQFADEMRDMRDKARDLEKKQEELVGQLAEKPAESTKKTAGLREEKEEKADVGKQLDEQRERLKELQEDMKNTVEQAESSEPLLSQKLYDAFRDTHKNQIDDQLRTSQQLSQRGLEKQSQQLAEAAQEGIQNLRKNVEQAAESILGDGTEGLRRAMTDLEQLAHELQNEIQREQPQPSPSDRDPNQSQDSQPRNREGQGGQQQNGEQGAQQQNGEGQGGQQQNGEEQNGEEQGGQRQNGEQGGQQQGGPQQGGQQQGRQRQNGEGQGGQQQGGEGQGGQQQNGEQQNGQPQNGEEQGGQQQGGQRQNGEEQNGQRQGGQQQGGQQQGGQQQGGQQQGGQQHGGQQQGGQQQGGQQQGGQQQGGQQQGGQQQGGQQQGGQQQGGQQQGGQQQGGQQQGGQQQGGQQQAGQQQGGQQQAGQQRNGQRNGNSNQRGGNNRNGGGTDRPGLEEFAGENFAPITGGDFRKWSDRLRDVEEMVDDPDLREEAAKIRDRARGFRRDFKRHSKDPKWQLVDEMVAKPLQELRKQVAAELLRRSAEKNETVPIDRDPVPSKFTRQVERYYESLGSGK